MSVLQADVLEFATSLLEAEQRVKPLAADDLIGKQEVDADE